MVRDRVRSETAAALLSNHALKIGAVAQCVGFAETASFSRAFSRWSGSSPARYRERLRSVWNTPKRKSKGQSLST